MFFKLVFKLEKQNYSVTDSLRFSVPTYKCNVLHWQVEWGEGGVSIRLLIKNMKSVCTDLTEMVIPKIHVFCRLCTYTCIYINSMWLNNKWVVEKNFKNPEKQKKIRNSCLLSFCYLYTYVQVYNLIVPINAFFKIFCLSPSKKF